MSAETIIELLLQHGSLGIFAGYLIWECTRLRQAQAAQVAKFEHLLKVLRDDGKEEQKEIRNRYDLVINELNQKSEASRTHFGEKVDHVLRRTDQIQVGLEDLKNQFNELRVKLARDAAIT